MKNRFLYSLISFELILVFITACGVLQKVVPGASTGSNGNAGNNVALEPTLPVKETMEAATATPPKIPNPVEKVRAGSHQCFDCVSDAYLADFPIFGGVPPVSFLTSMITFKGDATGNVIGGSIHFSIATNIGSNSENCATGSFDFDSDSGTGSFDRATHTLTMNYAGIQSYHPMGPSFKCGEGTSKDATLQFIFVHKTGGDFILCKQGETGDACVNNPMATVPY